MIRRSVKQFFMHDRRRWWSKASILILVGLLGGWRWAVFVLVLVAASEVLHSWTVRRNARQAVKTYAGEISASATAVTYVHLGKSKSIDWDEIESITVTRDPLTETIEWCLRSTAGVRRSISIPDHPVIRTQLMQCLAAHLPGFNARTYDDAVVEVLAQDNDAVIRCWSRPGAAGSPTSPYHSST